MASSLLRKAVSCTSAAAAIALIACGPAGAAAHTSVTSSHGAGPHTVGVVAHTYVVTTTQDEPLAGTAPAHRCQDENNLALCSLRAAFNTVSDDFDSSSNQWDVIKVPKGNYILNEAYGSLDTQYAGELSLEGAGPGQTIINGVTDAFDGELTYEGAEGSWSVTGVTFDGGDSSGTGGAFWESGGAAATFSDCSFVNNEAVDSGGAIYVESNGVLSVTDSTFTGNSATYDGGAIDDSGNVPLTLSGDTFSHNQLDGTSTSDDGGAVFTIDDASIDHSTFANNTAYGAGGAVYADKNLTGTNDTFSGNDSTDDSGGGIFASANISLGDSSFTGNEAVDGGGVYVNYTGYLSSDLFTSDRASSNGSDVFDDDSATIVDSTFTKGVANASGGSIYDDESSLTMTNDSVTDSVAKSDSYEGGGGIFVESGYVSLTNDSVDGNSDTESSAYGGGLGCYECLASIVGGQFENNKAGYAGGGVSMYNSSYLTVNGATINSNTAGFGAGIIIDLNSNLVVDDTTIDANNSTAYFGGGVTIYDGGDAQISNSTFDANRADGSEGWGGALAGYDVSASPSITLANDTLANNEAVFGGGIYVYETDLSVDSSTIAYNKLDDSPADYGGGIYDNSSPFFSTDSLWADNAGDQCGAEGVTADGGYNLDSDNSCGLTSAGDEVNKPGDLGSLAANGGPTDTILPTSTSLAVSGGGTACPSTDQRGERVPSGVTCSIGAVFVTPSHTTLKASHSSIVKGHEEGEVFSVAVVGKLKGDQPTGSVKIFDGTKLVCVAALKGVGKSLTSVGTCSPGASTLGTGSAHVTAEFFGVGAIATSTSAVVKVKVT